MITRSIRVSSVLAFLFFFPCFLYAADGTDVGKTAPDFSLNDMDGGVVKLSDYRGKVVMLDFWATWCGPCRSSIPELSRLYRQFKEKKFVLLGINMDRGGYDKVKKFVSSYGLEHKILRDADGSVSGPYGVSGIPAFFILDRNGAIVKKYVGFGQEMVPEWRETVSNLVSASDNSLPPEQESKVSETHLGEDISISADRGAIITSRLVQDSGTPYNLIRYVIPKGKKGEWKKDFKNIPSSGIEKVFFRMKGGHGGEKFYLGMRDSSQKELGRAVQLKGGEWQEIYFNMDVSGSIDSGALAQFFVRFSGDDGSGTLFIEDPRIQEKPAVVQKRVSSGKGAQASKPDALRGKKTEGQNPKEKVKAKEPAIRGLVRDFKRTPEDLKAVSTMLLESAKKDPATSKGMSDEEFMDLIQQRAFLFFWYEANPDCGVTLDRGRCFEPTGHDTASNASAGFGLTAMGIAHSRGWLTYEQAYNRVLKTLKFHRDKIENVHGFFYHWQEIDGRKKVSWKSEVSTIDTALFLAGVIFVGEYFKGTEVEKIANDIYLRVDWKWAHNNQKFCSMGVDFGGKVIGDSWNRYCEGLLLAILELGHPTANIDKSAWYDIAKADSNYKGYQCVSQTGPLFGYQYQHCWIDFRYKNDGWANHFEISTNETLCNRQYAIDLMKTRKGYGPNSWGFTASDHPDGYNPFAAPPGPAGENGTIAPTAPGGSFAFTPVLSLKAFRYMYDTWRYKIWGKYGFVDAYNIGRNWFDGDNIGIDQGPILLMIENYRTGLVWKYMMRNRYIQAAFNKIGFKDEPRATAKVWPLDLSGEDWLFSKGDQPAWSQANADDSGWRKIYVPDKFENQILEAYDGTVWYRKHFKISESLFKSWQGKEIVLHVGAIDDEDDTYLNGEKIGSSKGWDSVRIYKVNPQLLKIGNDNVVAIRVKDTTGDGGVWMRPVEIGPYLAMDWKPFKK